MGLERKSDRRMYRGFRQAHKVLGLVGGLLVLLSAASGILLQYPHLLGPPEVRVTAYSSDTGHLGRHFRGTTLGLEVSEDSGKTWREVPMLMPPGEIRKILISPENPDWVLVLGSDGLVTSRDGGRIWEPLDPTAGNDNSWQVFVDLAWAPEGGLDLATETGLMRSADEGVTWSYRRWADIPEPDSRRAMVHNLHTGFGLGQTWHLVVTVGAVLLIILTLTGLFLGLARGKGKVLLLLLVLVGTIWAGGVNAASPAEYHEEAGYLMGTVATAAAWASTDDLAEAAVEAALAEISRVESLMSTWNPDSEISQLNARTAATPVTVSTDLAAVLKAALALAEASQGAFDPTVLPLVQLWGFRSDSAVKAPSLDQVSACLEQVGYLLVGWNEDQGTVNFSRPGVQLDFGGIAKGYALDRAAEAMRGVGATGGKIDLGGGLLVFGTQATQQVGIVDPTGKTETLGAVGLSNGSMATSGQYERYREDGARRWGHILDPRTGFPCENLLSVTVLTESALLADAAATACFVLGADAGREFLEKIPGCEGIIVAPGQDGEPRIIFTTGLERD